VWSSFFGLNAFDAGCFVTIYPASNVTPSSNSTRIE
jgi:hypothetical protein